VWSLLCYQAQQVSQRDAPPVGGFGVLFFIKVWRLRFASVSGAPLTVTLGITISMQTYMNQLSLNYKHKGIPYGGFGESRDDGDANYGFKDLKGNNSLIPEIPELKRDLSLMNLVRAIDAPQTGLLSIGCVSGDIEDEQGFRNTGYVEISINSVSAITDAKNYFPLFFHFDRLLNSNNFSVKVHFDWELQPATFIDAKASGFTCTIIVNTHYSKTKLEAEASWSESLGVLGFFLGSVPREHHDLIYGQ